MIAASDLQIGKLYSWIHTKLVCTNYRGITKEIGKVFSNVGHLTIGQPFMCLGPIEEIPHYSGVFSGCFTVMILTENTLGYLYIDGTDMYTTNWLTENLLEQ